MAPVVAQHQAFSAGGAGIVMLAVGEMRLAVSLLPSFIPPSRFVHDLSRVSLSPNSHNSSARIFPLIVVY